MRHIRCDMPLPAGRYATLLPPLAPLRRDASLALALALSVITQVLLAVLTLLAFPSLTSKPRPGALVGLLQQLPCAPTAVGGGSSSNTFATPPVLVAAQAQTHPLKGQNLDPCVAATSEEARKALCPMPVYTSISLEKLYNIDERAYSFSAVVRIMLTWRDLRLNTTVNATGSNMTFVEFLKAMDVYGESERQAKMVGCEKMYSLYHNFSDDCKKGAQKDEGCRKPCGFVGTVSAGYQCCDDVWVPTLEIPNIITMTPDNIFSDDVVVLGAVYPFSRIDASAAGRLVRLQADFSTAFNFRKFPFDTQVLSLTLSVGSANYYIVPSITGRGVFSGLGIGQSFSRQSGQAAFDTDELTGWFIDDVDLTCDTTNSSTYTTAPRANANDPVAIAFNNVEVGQGYNITPNSTCTFNIHVRRISSNYVITLVVPVILTVLLSFTVFYVPPTDVATRLSTIIGLFLALTAVQFILNDQLPHASYATAMSWLILVSYIVMTVIVSENLFVFYINSLEEVWHKKRKAKERLLQSMRCCQSSDRRHDTELGITHDEVNGQLATSQELMPKSSPKGTPVRGPITFIKSAIDRTFRDNADHAFNVAILIDNISFAVLGIGYIIATIVIFCVGG